MILDINSLAGQKICCVKSVISIIKSTFITLILTLFLTSCAGTNPIDYTSRKNLKVEYVNIVWSYDDEDRETLPPNIEVSDEDYRVAKQKLENSLAYEILTNFKNSPNGDLPVVMVIDIRRFIWTGKPYTSLLGETNTVIANVIVKKYDDKTVLAQYNEIEGSYFPTRRTSRAIVDSDAQADIIGAMAEVFAINLRTKFDAY